MALTAVVRRSLRRAAAALVTTVIGIAIVLGGILVQRHQQAEVGALSDSQLLASADRTPEAEAFRARYGDAAPTVDRSGRVAVDYRSASAGAGVRLRLFIESGPTVREGFLECTPGALIATDVTTAIRTNACGS